MTALLAHSAGIAVCRLDQLTVERGAAVVVDGRQVAPASLDGAES